MTIFSEIEKKLENLFEGFFNRQFRSALQPVELAKKLAKELDRNKVVSIDRVYVPNELQINVSFEDHKTLEKIMDQLSVELTSYLVAHTKAKDYQVPSPFMITFNKDRILKVGELKIESAMSEPEPVVLPEPEVGGHTQIISPEEAAELGLYSSEEDAVLIQRETGQRYSIITDATTIGRQDDNDIVVKDPSVSRYHAKLLRQGPTYVIRDLNSTNGSQLNDSPLTEALLEDEDRLTFGKTDFIFRS